MTSTVGFGSRSAALAAMGAGLAVASLVGCTGGMSSSELEAARQRAEATCMQYADRVPHGWWLAMWGVVTAPAGVPGVDPGTKAVQCGWGSMGGLNSASVPSPAASCPPGEVGTVVGGGSRRSFLITSRGHAVPLPADKVSPPPTCVPSSDFGHPVNIDTQLGWPSLPPSHIP